MKKKLHADICIIGGGPGGLTVAAVASQLGAKVVLVEVDELGGDCLNRGCVPSKALIAAANNLNNIRSSKNFGIITAEPRYDFKLIHDHIRGVIRGIAPKDSIERFQGLGVNVIRECGKFVGPTRVQAGDTLVDAKRIVIATGSKPIAPSIPGLDKVDYLTNETIFNQRKAPLHLLVLGGGATGSELAQAYRRLGCKVTLLEQSRVLENVDPEVSEVVRNQMLQEGVVIHEGIQILRVKKKNHSIIIDIRDRHRNFHVQGSDLLVAVGREPELKELDLDKALIKFDKKGIKVDRRLRSSNKKVFAIGDVIGHYQFTHIAEYQAGIAIRNILFRLPAKTDYSFFPRVIFTGPEVAEVGMSEKSARERFGDIRILRQSFAENDRAAIERNVEGFAKIITRPNGIILGATIVGAHAGETIQSWLLPIKKKMKIASIAGLIVPYPTLGEINQRVARRYYMFFLLSEKVKRIVRFLLKFL